MMMFDNRVQSPYLYPACAGGLNQAARAVGMGALEPSRVRLFEGEATWMPGQLEDELAAGAWIALRLPRAMLESLVQRGPA